MPRDPFAWAWSIIAVWAIVTAAFALAHHRGTP
jgi:hypothetical protein